MESSISRIWGAVEVSVRVGGVASEKAVDDVKMDERGKCAEVEYEASSSRPGKL